MGVQGKDFHIDNFKYSPQNVLRDHAIVRWDMHSVNFTYL